MPVIALDGVERRLVRCFGLVFPELGADEIPVASPSSVGTWDSLASINLVAAGRAVQRLTMDKGNLR